MFNKKNVLKILLAGGAVLAMIISPIFVSAPMAQPPADGASVDVSLIEDVWFPSYDQRQSRNSAVKIEGMNGGHGSGTYIKMDGQYVVLTARHVVDRADIYYVVHQNEKVLGQVIWKSEQYDIAALKVPQIKSRKAVSLGDTGPLDVGEQVLYTGYPSSYQLLTARAYVSGHQLNYRATMLQGFVWFGYSGSGVFDSRGRVRGVIVAIGTEMFGPNRVPLETLVYCHEMTPGEVSQIKAALRGEN